MTIDTTEKTTLVVGGTGKTGRRVADRLRARNVPVRVASRSSEVEFRWEDRGTWAPALEGTTSAYISYHPDLAVPGASEAIAEFAELAVKSGARRLVLLSGRGEEEAQRSERALMASGADCTVVRCSWFNQNFSEGFFLEPVVAGEVALPVDGVPEPFVDVDDIADVAVASLIEDGHSGEVYELTGPRLLTFAEAVEEIGEAAGRDLRYVPIPVEAFSAALVDDGMPADAVGLMTFLFTEILDGRNASVMDGVQRALGRQPRDFRDYARDTAATGIWAEARRATERVAQSK